MRISLTSTAFCIPMLLVFTATSAANASSVPQKVKADDDRMICKYRQETGTRFKSKTCKTAAQWEEMAEQNRAGLKELVDRPQIEIRK